MTPPYPAAPPPPPGAAEPGRRDLFVLAGTAVALAVVAALVGARGWPTPERTLSGWQVDAVPTSLLVLLAVAALLSLGVAAVLTRPWELPVPAAIVWWLLCLAAVFALGWNDLYLAALAGPGGVIPVLDGFFTFLPALLVALAAIPAGRPAQLRAGLGTAVVGLPLMALGWALYGALDGFGSAVLGSLWSTAFFGVAPVAVALTLAVRLNRRTAPTG